MKVVVESPCDLCGASGSVQMAYLTVACARCAGSGKIQGAISLTELAQLLSDSKRLQDLTNKNDEALASPEEVLAIARGAQASERAAVVAFLRKHAEDSHPLNPYVPRTIADQLERGEHHTGKKR